MVVQNRKVYDDDDDDDEMMFCVRSLLFCCSVVFFRPRLNGRQKIIYVFFISIIILPSLYHVATPAWRVVSH